MFPHGVRDWCLNPYTGKKSVNILSSLCLGAVMQSARSPWSCLLFALLLPEPRLSWPPSLVFLCSIHLLSLAVCRISLLASCAVKEKKTSAKETHLQGNSLIIFEWEEAKFFPSSQHDEGNIGRQTTLKTQTLGWPRQKWMDTTARARSCGPTARPSFILGKRRRNVFYRYQSISERSSFLTWVI